MPTDGILNFWSLTNRIVPIFLTLTVVPLIVQDAWGSGSEVQAASEARTSDEASEEPPKARAPPQPGLMSNSFETSVAFAAKANALPLPFLKRLIWQESRFNPRALSR